MNAEPIATPQVFAHEVAALSCCLLDDEARALVLDRLEDVDVLDPNGRKALKAMRQIDARGGRPSVEAIRLEVEAAGASIDLGYLTDLEVDLPDIYRVASYVETIKRARIRRELLDGAREIAMRCKQADDSALSAAREMLQRVERVDSAPETLSFRGQVDAALRELNERKVGGVAGVSTGLRRLDKLTLGMQPGQLILVAGRPGVGKSVLALHMAREAAFRGRKGVALASLEMAPQEIVHRVLSAETQIEHERIRGNYLNDIERHQVRERAQQIAGWDLHIEDAIGWTTDELERRVRSTHRRYGIDLVIVDYLGLLRTERQHHSDNSRISEISLALKHLARSLSVPVVALAQLSRECEKRVNKRPILSDLRDSGSLEQDADVVLFLYRESYYDPNAYDDPSMEIIIGKQRAGQTGIVPCRFYPKTMQFEDAP